MEIETEVVTGYGRRGHGGTESGPETPGRGDTNKDHNAVGREVTPLRRGESFGFDGQEKEYCIKD